MLGVLSVGAAALVAGCQNIGGDGDEGNCDDSHQTCDGPNTLTACSLGSCSVDGGAPVSGGIGLIVLPAKGTLTITNPYGGAKVPDLVVSIVPPNLDSAPLPPRVLVKVDGVVVPMARNTFSTAPYPGWRGDVSHSSGAWKTITVAFDSWDNSEKVEVDLENGSCLQAAFDCNGGGA